MLLLKSFLPSARAPGHVIAAGRSRVLNVPMVLLARWLVMPKADNVISTSPRVFLPPLPGGAEASAWRQTYLA